MKIENFFHILNPNRSHRKSVQHFFKDHPDFLHRWVDRSSHPTHLETLVEWAVWEKKTKIAVWGGDGSFSRVVQALYQFDALHDVTVCLIPVGTGNDFARKLSPKSFQTWISLLLKGDVEKKTFDTGLLKTESADRVFVNNAGFGRSREALERPRSNPIKDIAAFEERKIHLEWGTEKVKQYQTLRLVLGIIFNSPFFNKGMFFDRTISAEDGLLSAFFVAPQKKKNFLLRFLGSWFGRSLHRSTDLRVDADYIQIDSDDFLYPQVDGEVVSLAGVKKIKFSVLDRALTMLVPTF